VDDIWKRITHGVTWVTLGKGLLMFLAMATNVLLTRLLPPADVGTWFLLFSIISVVALVAQAGFNEAIIRLVAEAKSGETPHSVRGIISTSFILVTVVTLITAVLFYGGIGSWISRKFFQLTLTDTMLILSTTWLVLLVYRNLLAQTFRGLSDFRHATLFEGLLEGLAYMLLLGGLYALYGTGSLQQIFILAIAACGFATFTAAITLRRQLRSFPATDHAPLNAVFSTAWPLWVSGITLFVLGKADLWILGMFRNLDEVGIYGAVSRLATFITFTLLIANAVIPPMIAEMNARGSRQTMEKTLRSVATLSTLPALAALIIFIAWPGPLLEVLYGEFYRNGSTVLIILGSGHLVNVACGSCGYALMMTGHQVLMMIISLFSGSASILMAYLLAPEFGGPGVAASVSAALVVQNILMLAAVRKYLGIWTHADPRMLWACGRKSAQGA
jgi:O-antigen/teichoic acid export membrane protein